MTPETAIASLLDSRAPGATICPSEAARLLAGDGGDWRARMGDVHDAVAGMSDKREVALSWKGEAKASPDGPYRIGRPV